MTLYIVATPIGNLSDLSARALETLRAVDEIACEDTRHTRKLLSHYQISKPLISYHSYNQTFRAEQILEKLKEGEKIALVSDAGTPGISDPGTQLVQLALENEIEVIPIPGASALITALCASGLPTDRFYFHGFLPLKPGKRRAVFESLKNLETTLIFYESGRRLSRLLSDLEKSFGNKKTVIARELTKIYEEFLRGSLHQLIEGVPREGLKGECVVLLDNRSTSEKSLES